MNSQFQAPVALPRGKQAPESWTGSWVGAKILAKRKPSVEQVTSHRLADLFSSYISRLLGYLKTLFQLHSVDSDGKIINNGVYKTIWKDKFAFISILYSVTRFRHNESQKKPGGSSNQVPTECISRASSFSWTAHSI